MRIENWLLFIPTNPLIYFHRPKPNITSFRTRLPLIPVGIFDRDMEKCVLLLTCQLLA